MDKDSDKEPTLWKDAYPAGLTSENTAIGMYFFLLFNSFRELYLTYHNVHNNILIYILNKKIIVSYQSKL